ncbi:MAG: CotH kinase family protein [Verrucomicrobiia bacterium]
MLIPFLFWMGLAQTNASTGNELQINGKGMVPGAELFDADKVLKIKLNIAQESLKNLEKDPRKYVPCELIEGGIVYSNVAVHLKGAAGSFRGIYDKPAFTLSFNRFLPGQRFYGLRKIHLNNSVQDPSFICENLCGELFRKAGVPAARANWALVELNGKKLGLYVLKEGFTKDFLSLYFKNTKGNLYDGGFLKEITEPLELDSGGDVTDRSDLKSLAAAAMERELPKRWQRLNEVLDVERFISYMVMENMTWDWDGYVMNRNNYRLYHNLDEGGRMIFIPHGMDQMFWEPGAMWNTPPNGLVARALIEIPEAKQLYRQRYIELLETVFVPYFITNRIAKMVAAVEPVLEKEDKNLLNQFRWGVSRVQDLILKRIENLNRQLIKPLADAVKFQENIGKIDKWEERRDNNAQLSKVKIGDKEALQIEVNGVAKAGFFSRVFLKPGVYRLEAMVKAEGVAGANDNEFGARLSASIDSKSQSPAHRIWGTTSGWTKLSYEFEIMSVGKEVELMCELNSPSGKAWFDANSIQLIRVK